GLNSPSWTRRRCPTTAASGPSCGRRSSQSRNKAGAFAHIVVRTGHAFEQTPRDRIRCRRMGRRSDRKQGPMTVSGLTKLNPSLLALLIAFPATGGLGQGRPQRQQAPQTQTEQRPQDGGVLRLLPADSVTEHSIETAWGKLDYTATAGTLSLFDQSGERSAAIFYTAYVGKTADPTKRPVTFVFNGGPGAASAYLHIGLVGPRVLDFGPGNRDGVTPRLQDNPNTWLAFTDLVLIDPVGTGWSRAAKPDGAAAFWGVQRDAEAIAKTIALYVSHNQRSASPKYLLGESYGGFRAAKVARALKREQGITVSGITMVSPLLESALIFGGTRFALGAALQLPSL